MTEVTAVIFPVWGECNYEKSRVNDAGSVDSDAGGRVNVGTTWSYFEKSAGRRAWL